ncbi:carboxypeptidase regulatory-like domain-containing protein [Myxococcus sp. CA051A]|uniref:carboxypeptidase-like regulatory domain-containing protein n=1 Tax=unclassified Myxococcus TaxID=2648731 RepID=UPI00157B00D0|nr:MULTISPECIES: carboxypeptidase-like regulatory domain-containing protein [unclassified Myxococcus]NTX56707.1 carboxypeptidase regulatory-like domain-containing protein [Myxococcus sp. CA039A]NTX64426.1 carboxypeptidase regulatory-like domain-containing protein [Myxococcus sp. CA051A]
MMKKHLVMAVVPFLALGCGDDFKDENGDGIADGIREPDSVTVVTPATPKGTVSGQVLSTDLKALSEATVEVTIGSSADPLSATTDAKGNFEFKDVPAGSQVLLTFTKTGYATLRASSTIPSSAGNVPINNANVSFGPVTLTRLDGSLRFLLVTPQGRPAANVRATLEASPAGTIILSNTDNTTRVVSTVVVEATSDDQGVLTFQGIPTAQELARLSQGQYRLWVSAVDSNSDGVPETNGYVGTYPASNVVASGTTRLINLPNSRDTSLGSLNVEGSNVAMLRGAADPHPLRNMVRPGEPIYLYFNQPVQQSSLLARLTDEYAKEALPVTVALGNGGYSATITPGNGVVQAGKEYNIDLRAVSVETGELYSRVGYFFGGEVGSVSPVTIAEARYQETSLTSPTSQQLNDGERIYINFSSPVFTPFFLSDAAKVQVFFNFDIDNNGTVGGASFGEVNNFSGQGFVLNIDEPTSPYVTRSVQPERPVFAISASGYSTRYSFIYTTVTATPLVSLIPNNVPFQVAFSKLGGRGVNQTYESIWGQPITTDLAVTGIAIQAAPTPPTP